jgi:hypothetical protein
VVRNEVKMHEKERKTAQLMEETIRSQDMEALRYVMESPLGRHFMARLLDATRIYSPLSNETTLLDEGRRRVGLEYVRLIQSMGLEGMKLLHQMEEEYAEKRIELERMKTTWKS